MVCGEFWSLAEEDEPNNQTGSDLTAECRGNRGGWLAGKPVVVPERLPNVPCGGEAVIHSVEADGLYLALIRHRGRSP